MGFRPARQGSISDFVYLSLNLGEGVAENGGMKSIPGEYQPGSHRFSGTAQGD